MAEVKYSVTYKKPSLQRFLEKASKNCRGRFQYFMNIDDDAKRKAAAAANTSQTGTVTDDGGTSQATSKRAGNYSMAQMGARTKSKLRRKNPHYATLEDAIAKNEEKFQATIIKDLENAAYYPPRPAMKFIPTPRMTH